MEMGNKKELLNKIKENLKDLFFKIDLKNNSNDKVIEYCDFLNFDSNIVLSLKNSFNFDFIWSDFDGNVFGFIIKDDFTRTNISNGMFEEKINPFHSIGLNKLNIDLNKDASREESDYMLKVIMINTSLSSLDDNEFKSLVFDMNSFSFEEENDVVDDRLDEEDNIDKILEKISRYGIDKLTIREKNILDEFSKSL